MGEEKVRMQGPGIARVAASGSHESYGKRGMMDADAAMILKPSVEKFVAVCERFMSLLERVEKLVVKKIEAADRRMK
jgi:hypothetical protein